MVRLASDLDRRDFIRVVTSGMALLPALGTSGLAQVLGPRRSRVAIVRTTDRKRGVTDVLKLLNLKAVKGKKVVIKPNFNSADDTPGSTHNDTLSQLVTELHALNARGVTLGESSGPPQTQGVMEKKGTFDLAKQFRFDIVDYEQNTEKDWVTFPAAGSHWSEGFTLPRLIVDAEYTVSTCCLKTHGSGGVFSMSLKLAVGLTPKSIRRGMHRSPDMRRMIAELNTGYRPNLIVLDGVAAFTDGGPSRGELKAGNVMIAGDDRVAVDAVGVAVLKSLGANQAIMGRKIFEQEQIARAVDLKLGVASADAIDLVTGDADSKAMADTLRPILAEG
ncbi:MAG: DUF362 domain-containing protein [Acidobacteria bacterium]|nr:DUF362 domain-containing protein [Acidobacteriota bacterium]